jgi:hypothetical protein
VPADKYLMANTILNDLVYIPLDVPKIEPDDWSVFWKVWNTDSKMFIRRYRDSRGNNLPRPGWTGFVWNFTNSPPTNPMYDVVYKDYSFVFPKMKQQLLEYFPITIRYIQFLSNYREIPAHQDGTVYTDHYTFPCDLRVMLYDENKRSTFYLKNIDQRNQPGVEQFIELPKETNSFVYTNPSVVHGARFYGHQKIILSFIFEKFDIGKWQELLMKSYEKYTAHSRTKQNLIR